MEDVLSVLSDTPLPTILVVGGMFFLVLAFASQIGGKIQPKPERQRLSGICGAVLLVAGIALYFIPRDSATGTEATPAGESPAAEAQVAVVETAAPEATVEQAPTAEPAATEPPAVQTPLASATSPPPEPPAGPAYAVSGAFADVWARHGDIEGPLGAAVGPETRGSFAEQRFERGLMHWGHPGTSGTTEILVIEHAAPGNRSAGAWDRFPDTWREGEHEFSCDEAEPSLGPKRGFGRVWCDHARDALGKALEEERSSEGSYQEFEGGVMLWSPAESGIYLLFNQGDWLFEDRR
jgi:hypothetical protein